MLSSLTLASWDAMSADERRAVADRIGRNLPPGFESRGIERVEWLGRSRDVAVFAFDGAKFVLVPGGDDVTLGFDGRAFAPTPAQAESFADTAEAYDIPDSIQAFVDRCTTPPRRVRIAPFLIEAEAWEASVVPAPVDDPAILKLADETGGRHQGAVELHVDGQHARLDFDPDGRVVRAWRLVYRPPEVLRADLRAVGFRLPTSDEWEYSCGAGARTLFRWGDGSPCDRYPTDDAASPADDVHRRPNAFGLSIASDPYVTEHVEEVGVARGGDGGAAICGGAGEFLGWLALATAYVEPELAQTVDEFGWVRRVVSVG
jgi:hypothetical protein